MAQLQGATKAYADYLTGDALALEDFAKFVEDAGTYDVEDPADVAAALTAYFGTGIGAATTIVAGLNTEINTAVTGQAVDTGRSDALNNAVIEEARTEVNAKLTAAQNAVNKITGLDKAVSGYNAAQESFKDSTEAQAATTADLNAEFARVDGLNSTVTSTAKAVSTYPADAEAIQTLITTATGTAGTAQPLINGTISGSSVALIEINTKGQIVVAAAGKDLPGIAQLLAAVQADFVALQSKAAAEAAYKTAIGAVLDAENEGGVEVVLDADTSGGTITVTDLSSGGAKKGTEALYVDGKGDLFLIDVIANANVVYKVTNVQVDDLSAKDTVGEVTVTVDRSKAVETVDDASNNQTSNNCGEKSDCAFPKEHGIA